MTFQEVQGDLFSVAAPEEYYYAHCISADYALGAGIARAFNSKYNMSRRLRELPASKAMLVDNVFNLVTKSKYWQKPTYESLTASLVELKQHCLEKSIKKLAMPKIGCGLDKLQWGKVRKIIKDLFEDTDIDILVCFL